MKFKLNIKKQIQPAIKLKFDLHVILATLFLVVPMINYLNGLLHGFVFTFFVFITWFMVVVFNQKVLKYLLVVLFKRKYELFFLFLFIGVIAFNNFFIQSNDLSRQYLYVFMNVFLILIMDSYYAMKDPNYRFSIFFFITVILGIQAMISIPYFLSVSNNIARMYTSGGLSDQLRVEATKNGIGHSSLYLSIVPLLFLITSLIKMYRRIGKVFLAISFCCLLLSVLLSSFFTPIFVFFIGIIILIWRKHLFSKKMIIYSVFALVLLIYFYTNYISSTRILDPVIERASGLVDGTGSSLGTRNSLASQSWNTFLNNPFLGIGVVDRGSYDLVGGHNNWMDFLAYFGLFGILPFLIFLSILVKKNLQFYFPKGRNEFYRTCCFIGLIIFLFSNNVVPSLTRQSMIVIIFFFCTSSSNYLFLRKSSP